MATRSPHLPGPLQNGGCACGQAAHGDPRPIGSKFVCKNEKKFAFNIDINFVCTIFLSKRSGQHRLSAGSDRLDAADENDSASMIFY